MLVMVFVDLFDGNGGSLDKAAFDEYYEASSDEKNHQELKAALSGYDSGVCTQDDFFKALTAYYASH